MKIAILLLFLALLSIPFVNDSTAPTHNMDDDQQVNEPPDDNGDSDDDNGGNSQQDEDTPVVVENEAFKISSPSPGESVGDSLKMKGMARVFEAAFQYELSDGELVVAQGVIMASAGAPEWGSFEKEIHLDRKPDGPLVLKIFTASPKDGSETNVLEIPLGAE